MKTRNKIIYIPRPADLSPDSTLTAGGPDSGSPRCSEPELRADAKMTLPLDVELTLAWAQARDAGDGTTAERLRAALLFLRRAETEAREVLGQATRQGAP